MQYKEEDGRFVALDGDKTAGEVTFQPAGDSMLIIDHTYVSDAYRGQGIAAELVRHVVEKARQMKVSIVPLCPFAKAEFARKPAYHDVDASHHAAD